MRFFLSDNGHTDIQTHGQTERPSYTKTLKKKDALLKPQFDRLPVIKEQKLKKGIKALVLSFHLQRPAAL